MELPKSVCDNCVYTECLWRAPTGGNDPPVMICPDKIDKPKNNADRIRAMTDEELASLLMYFADDTGEIDEKDYDAFCDMEWRERMLRWLKQEIKE